MKEVKKSELKAGQTVIIVSEANSFGVVTIWEGPLSGVGTSLILDGFTTIRRSINGEQSWKKTGSPMMGQFQFCRFYLDNE